MFHLYRFITLCALIVFSISLSAQQSPKVGLVLSGGGAKGMAHIGVLKVLEELGIVPDYITGTSMGAVVGGLYAAGYSAAELEEIALTADWDILLGNQIPYQSISVEQKPFYGRSQLVLPIENYKIGLPKGVIEGQELYELLVDLTAPVHSINDFDELPRPFRCIGADIVTGEKVVLSEGFLPEAIRASMAIPSIFTPVEIDGHLLVDGGLIHNFPVIEAIEMGADIIIGVSVSDSLVDRSKLNSLVAILSQATFIGSVKETEKQKQLVDYFIRPTLHPYSTGSFGNGDSIIVRGETAARAMYDELKSLADSLKALRTFDPIHAPQIDTLFRITEVRVVGNENIPSRVVEAKLGVEAGDDVSREELSDAITRVFGTLAYDRVTYDLDFIPSGAILTVNVKETTPGQARFNLHYDTENGVGLMTTLQFRGLGLSDSRLVLEADIAETPYFLGEYSLYLGADQNMAASIGAKYSQDNLLLFNEAGDASASYRTKLWRYFLNFNTTKYLDRMLGIQIYSDVFTMKPTVAGDDSRLFGKLRYNNFGTRIYWTIDRLEQRLLPRRGFELRVSGYWNFHMDTDLSESEVDPDDVAPDYQLVSFDVDYTQYFPIGDKWTFWTSHLLRLTNTRTDKLNVPDWHFMGGFRPNFINTSSFWGAEKYQFQLTSFYKAAVGIRYLIVKQLHASLAANFVETEYPMRWFDEEQEFFDREPAGGLDRRLGFLLDVTYTTRVGPIRFSLAKDVDNKQFKPWFSIGYNFPHDPDRGN